MISTIEELVALTELEAAEDLARGFPEIAERSRLRTPGLNEDEVAELLNAFPEMPASYLDIARRVSLFHTDMGFFFGWSVPMGAMSQLPPRSTTMELA